MSSRLATSSAQALPVPPLAAISAATPCAPSAAQSVTATLAPSAANTRAVARPMPLAAPVTRTLNPFTDRLSGLKSDIECSLKMMSCTARLTRLTPIRREVKPREIEDRGCDERTGFQRQAGSGGGRLQRHR